MAAKAKASVAELIEAAAHDPKLTLEGGTLALMRFTLLKCVEAPDTVRVSDVAEVIAAAGKVLESGSGGDLTQDDLKSFLAGG